MIQIERESKRENIKKRIAGWITDDSSSSRSTRSMEEVKIHTVEEIKLW